MGRTATAKDQVGIFCGDDTGTVETDANEWLYSLVVDGVAERVEILSCSLVPVVAKMETYSESAHVAYILTLAVRAWEYDEEV